MGDFETRLLISTESTDFFGDDSTLRIKLYPVKVYPDGTIRNFGTGSWDREPLADLVITGQSDHVSNEVYGWHTEFRSPYSVDLATAEAMMKVLKKVERGLEKLRSEFGHPEAFTAYVARVAKIIGVAGYGWTTDRHSDFASNEYHWTDADGMTYRINAKVAEFRKVNA